MSSEDPDSLRDLPGGRLGSHGAKSVMEEAAEYIRKATQFISEEIKSESRSIAADQLNLASKKLDVFAEGFREAAGKLRKKDSYSLANIMEMGSESIMNLSGNLRAASPEKLISDMKNFARRQPGTFLAAAMVGGFLLGQMFSSRGGSKDKVDEFRPRKDSSFEYVPGNDEEEYYVPH